MENYKALKKPPCLSYTNTSILLNRKPENQHIKNGVKRANLISQNTFPFMSFFMLAKLANEAQRTGTKRSEKLHRSV